MKTFASMILGCKVNDYEATCICNQMKEYFTEVPFSQPADIYLIFTCCVTNVAEAKTRKFLHRARRQNPNSFIVAIGCMSQVKGDTADFDDADLIIGSSQKDKVVEYIKENVIGYQVKSLDRVEYENLYLHDYPHKSRAFLKIQDGCNQFCSYCIIPYSRGRERSCDYHIALAQAKELSVNYQEIVLTGIHTGRYNDGSYNLAELIKKMQEFDGIKTIRLSSIELNEVTDEIISLVKNGKLAPHLHIPIQAASDEILKSMHRPYDIETFIDRISQIRKEIPDISISTDLIVGYPSESDELFNKSLSALEKIKFSFIHVFPYARKKGTFADSLNGHIKETVKKERVQQILAFSKNSYHRYISSFIGHKVSVLIEKVDDGYSYGYSRQYFPVKIKGEYPIGQIIDVMVLGLNEEQAEGELCF